MLDVNGLRGRSVGGGVSAARNEDATTLRMSAANVEREVAKVLSMVLE
jgi:hypothetical protein